MNPLYRAQAAQRCLLHPNRPQQNPNDTRDLNECGLCDVLEFQGAKSPSSLTSSPSLTLWPASSFWKCFQCLSHSETLMAFPFLEKKVKMTSLVFSVFLRLNSCIPQVTFYLIAFIPEHSSLSKWRCWAFIKDSICESFSFVLSTQYRSSHSLDISVQVSLLWSLRLLGHNLSWMKGFQWGLRAHTQISTNSCGEGGGDDTSSPDPRILKWTLTEALDSHETSASNFLG